MSPQSQRPLRVLIVEDTEDDAELLLRELSRGGFDVTYQRVETDATMRTALTEHDWDIIVSDYSMPEFDANAALALARSLAPDLPFIIISGTIGEEIAVQALKAGAQDFLLKGRLARLIPAIDRELREARDRRARRAAQTAAEDARREQVRAEAASQAKSAFLAHMSHELRTPLNAIIGFSELLAEGQGGALTPIQADFVENVLVGGRHLLSLINDILDLSKIEAGRMELARQPTALGATAEQVRDLLMPLIDSKGLTITVAIPPEMPLLDADPMRLKQIFYNLLSNGIKFTPSGGQLKLTATVEAGQAVIAVSDTGVGIRVEDVPKLFREFEQLAEGKQPGVEGTGLGLALTKRLVELHGGTISVDSHLGRGTTFTMRLPIPAAAARPRPPTAVPAMIAAAAAVRGCILLVEDDPPSRRLVRAVLERVGHRIFEAESVGAALAILAEHEIDLIITDIQIPGGGGQQVLAAVRSHPTRSRMPVLATTAHAMQGDRERLLAAGFDGYLSKPISTRELGPFVEAFLLAASAEQA